MTNRDRAAYPPVAGLICALALACVGGVACTKNGSDNGDVGEVEVVMEPPGGSTTTVSDLRASASVRHPVGTPAPSFSFRWERDGTDVGNTTQTVDSGETAKHQTWEVFVIADFGTSTKSASARIDIVNAPPRVPGVAVSPFPACDGDTLSTSFTPEDDDGDPITGTFHEWFVNGTSVATTETLDPSFFGPADRVTVEVRASDPEETGDPGRGVTFPEIIPQPGQEGCPASLTGSSGRRLASSDPFPAMAFGVSPAQAAAAAAVDAADEDAAAAPVAVAAPGPRPIGVGDTHVCSIGSDGGVQCSGPDGLALGDSPDGAYSQVAVAVDYACAIRTADLGIDCWGAPPQELGLLSPPAGAFVQLALASDVGCGLRETGELACWGDPGSALAHPPDGLYRSIDVAEELGCAVSLDGQVQCWGVAAP